MTVMTPVIGLLSATALFLWWQSRQRIAALETRLRFAEEAVDKFRQLLNEMRGEEEVRRILAEAEELKRRQAAIVPVRHDISTISELQEHLELFKSGSTCLFAGDDGLKHPSLYIVHLQNRIGDVEVTREIVHIRFRPGKPDQMRSAITKHLFETAAKLYVGRKVQAAADKTLPFVMPTAGMVEAFDETSAETLLAQLGVAPA